MSSFSENRDQNLNSPSGEKIRNLHLRAVNTAKDFKRLEVELIDILGEIEANKAFFRLGYKSLFDYTVNGLGLSEGVAYPLITVVRTAKKIPALKEEIRSGGLSVYKVKKIASVITVENQSHWISKAKDLTVRKIEREVSLESPHAAIPSLLNYVSVENEVKEKVRLSSLPFSNLKSNPSPGEPPIQPRVQLQVGISERTMLKIRRLQDVLSQKQRTPVSLETVIDIAIDASLNRIDPVKKAERAKIRGKLRAEVSSEPSKNEAGTLTNLLNRMDLSNNIPLDQSTDATQATKPIPIPSLKPLTIPSSIISTIENTNSQNQKKLLLNENSTQKTGRVKLKKNLFHQVMLRDQGRCTYKEISGELCGQTRFLEVHHVVPLSDGGEDKLENLQLLCSGHHKMTHLTLKAKSKQLNPLFRKQSSPMASHLNPLLKNTETRGTSEQFT